MNQLHWGDNLEALRELPNVKVDLVYADPPFNSGRNYKADAGSFKDKWEWTEESDKTRKQIKEKAIECSVAFGVNRALDSYDILFGDAFVGKYGSLMAYLAFLGIRLIELHRVLKPTGSIYLHCDSTASHYIKSLIDQAFGIDNFRNEIVWAYRRYGSQCQGFQKTHDIILQYSKTDSWIWNQLFEPKSESTLKRFGPYKMQNTFNGDKRTGAKALKNEICIEREMRNVWEISIIAGQANERVGYPTQKPIALLKRIIQASSNQGDIVLDPFAGSGTTLDAAQLLNRNWIGIDQEPQAIETITKRLADEHGLLPDRDYGLIGTIKKELTSLTLPTKSDIGPVQISLF